jgi:hypothetical protein
MCADTTVQEEEEEEDPSDGKLDYALDEDAILSDLSSGNSFTSSFSPITNTTSSAYNQVNQEELQSDFNITYNKGESPTSLSPINTNTDSVTPSNQFKLITPMQKHTRSKSAAGNSSPQLSFDNTIIDISKSAAGGAYNQFNSITPVQQYCRASSTIQSQSSGNQASTQKRSLISIENSGALSEFLEAAMRQSKGENNTVDLNCPEESHENAGGAKPDKDDQDGQDYKKQRSAELSRTGEKRKSRAVKNQQKSRLFLSERRRLHEFSQSNRILLVIPSSQSVNEEYSTVHTLNPSIEAVDAEILRVYDDIVKDYPDLIIETGRTETTISYKLHELVPFSIGLCREMEVRDNSNKDSLAIRSAILRDGSLHKVFANCIRIVTNEYVNNIAQFIIVQSFLF